MDSKIAQFALDVLKLAPRYLAALAIVTAILLFSPDALLKKLGLDQLASDYRAWWGGMFVVSVVLFLVDRSTLIIQWVKRLWTSRQYRDKQLTKLKSLTEAEQRILRFYIFNQTKTNVLMIGDGVVNGLVSAGVIFRAHKVGVEDDRFAYNITEFSWNHLCKDKSLLGEFTATRNDQLDDSW